MADHGGVSGPDWFDGAAQRIVAQVDDEPWTAVLHSSAGAFAPSLSAVAARLKGLVFVDAVLPHPGKSAADLAPRGQIDGLRKITSEGLIARWDRWFAPAVIESWAPDAKARATCLADIPQVPLAFLEAQAPCHAEWERLPATYVKLSEGFERNATRAEALGWNTRRLDLGHLGMISHPAALAATLLDVR
ncbi:alpha/beta fold hydrolase [Phenylobacterium aquaticum]|uniref:alpha/beta fold hydrolase n=1 Tax=Phenylobacterium aquaticum TaxID=1763816 RepID=UPI0026EC5205|nr:alpha/beta fold hydrolase [Phenylobacterium aquaticum]